MYTTATGAAITVWVANPNIGLQYFLCVFSLLVFVSPCVNKLTKTRIPQPPSNPAAGLCNLDPLEEDAMLELPPPPVLGFRASWAVSSIKASPLQDALANTMHLDHIMDANELSPAKPPSPILTCVSAVKHMTASTNIATKRKLANSPLGGSLNSLDGAAMSGRFQIHTQDSATSGDGE